LSFAVYNTTQWFADVGVKLPYANNGTAIFIYANNSAAATASDGLNTFDFYDDFNSATVNTTKWFVVDNVTANSPTAGWVDIMSDSSAADSLTSRSPPWPIANPGIFEFRGRSYHVSTAVGERVFNYQTDYARYWAEIFSLSTKLTYSSYNGTSVGTNSTRMKGWNAKSDNVFEMDYDALHRTMTYYINGTLDNQLYASQKPWGSSFTALNISFATYTSTAEIALDWVLTRKFANETPTGYTTLPLEVNISGAPAGAAPVAAFSCTPLTTVRNGTITCTDASTNTPTSWDWYSPDSQQQVLFSGNITNQNPNFFPHKLGGYFSVNLIATNAFGTSTKASGSRYIWVQKPLV
jgi:hypothetical protein